MSGVNKRSMGAPPTTPAASGGTASATAAPTKSAQKRAKQKAKEAQRKEAMSADEAEDGARAARTTALKEEFARASRGTDGEDSGADGAEEDEGEEEHLSNEEASSLDSSHAQARASDAAAQEEIAVLARENKAKADLLALKDSMITALGDKIKAMELAMEQQALTDKARRTGGGASAAPVGAASAAVTVEGLITAMRAAYDEGPRLENRPKLGPTKVLDLATAMDPVKLRAWMDDYTDVVYNTQERRESGEKQLAMLWGWLSRDLKDILKDAMETAEKAGKPITNWEEAQNELLNQFGADTDREIAHRALINIKMGASEDIIQFSTRAKGLWLRCAHMADSVTMGRQFLEGVHKEHYAQTITTTRRELRNKGAMTFQDTVRFMRNAALDEPPTNLGKIKPKTQVNNITTEESKSQIAPITTPGGPAAPAGDTAKRGNKKTRWCENCKTSTHMTIACRSKRSCYGCGAKDHIRNDCPTNPWDKPPPEKKTVGSINFIPAEERSAEAATPSKIAVNTATTKEERVAAKKARRAARLAQAAKTAEEVKVITTEPSPVPAGKFVPAFGEKHVQWSILPIKRKGHNKTLLKLRGYVLGTARSNGSRKVHRVEFIAMLDTGAQAEFISRPMLERLGGLEQVATEGNFGHAVEAFGKETALTHAVEDITLHFSGINPQTGLSAEHAIPCDLLVAPEHFSTQYDMLLGMPFLRHCGARLTFNEPCEVQFTAADGTHVQLPAIEEGDSAESAEPNSSVPEELEGFAINALSESHQVAVEENETAEANEFARAEKELPNIIMTAAALEKELAGPDGAKIGLWAINISALEDPNAPIAEVEPLLSGKAKALRVNRKLIKRAENREAARQARVKFETATDAVEAAKAVLDRLEKGEKNEKGGTAKLEEAKKVLEDVTGKLVTATEEVKVAVNRLAHGAEVGATAEEKERTLLPLGEREAAEAIVKKLETTFSDVFPAELPGGVPPLRGDQGVRIETVPGARPVGKYGPRMTQEDSEEAARQLEELQRKGFIRPSRSPHGAPMFFVAKPDGTKRMVIDYRALNANTVRNRYPLPRVDELFDQLQGARYFSKIDLRTGYWQIRMAEDSIEKTAFTSRHGHFEWTVLPMGLTNAPAEFMKLMEDTFREELNKSVLVFLDDILIYSKTMEEHEAHLRAVLMKLRARQLYAKLSKCHFFRQEVDFLGHYVGRAGIRMMHGKVSAVENWPTPTKQKDVEQFLGVAGYYRRFIPGFSRIAAPLTALTGTLAMDKKGATRLPPKKTWQWGEEEQAAFEQLKAAVVAAPCLAMPDPSREFIVHTDASGYATGAALMQRFDEGLRPIAFLSRKMNAQEKNYPVHEQELLAILYALKAWRHYLADKEFTVVTDHQSLQYLTTSGLATPRQVRWAALFSEFQFKIKYAPGKDHLLADGLSRGAAGGDSKEEQKEGDAATEVNAVTIEDEQLAIAAIEQLTPVPVQIREVAGEDEEYQGWLSLSKEELAAKHMVEEDGLLYRADDKGGQLVVPKNEELRNWLRAYAHDSLAGGHRGGDRMYAWLKERVWWSGMSEECARWATSCELCQRNKPDQRGKQGLPMSLETPPHVWHTLGIDFIGPLTRSRGYNAIMTVVDKLSRFVFLVPLNTDATAVRVYELLVQHVLGHTGFPHAIVSDRDSRFTSKFWEGLFKGSGTELKMSTAFHPQTDGATERMNRQLIEMIRSYVNPRHDNWSQMLPDFAMAINASKCEVTGTSPFELVYGQPMRSGMEGAMEKQGVRFRHPGSNAVLAERAKARADALEVIRKAQDRQRLNSMKGRRAPEIKVGDKAFLRNKNFAFNSEEGTRKLRQLYEGPYRVLEMRGENAARLELPANSKLKSSSFNLDLLKKAREEDKEFPLRPRALARPGAVLQEDPNAGGPGEAEYEVAEITNKKTVRGQDWYLVRWEGWPAEQSTWTPVEELQGCIELVAEFEQVRRAAAAPSRAHLHRGVRDNLPRQINLLMTAHDTPLEYGNEDGWGINPLRIRQDERLTPEERAQRETTLRNYETNAPLGTPRPPPNKNGAVIMGQHRCVADTVHKRWCKQKTRFGCYCWVHLASKKGTKIKKSRVKGAGMGLWSARAFKKGERIAEYTGDYVRTGDNIDVSASPYVLQLTQRISIDAARTDSAEGRMLNDPRGTPYHANCEFKANLQTKTGYIQASKDIPADTELFINYGADYWQHVAGQKVHRGSKVAKKLVADQAAKRVGKKAVVAAKQPGVGRKSGPRVVDELAARQMMQRAAAPAPASGSKDNPIEVDKVSVHGMTHRLCVLGVHTDEERRADADAAHQQQQAAVGAARQQLEGEIDAIINYRAPRPLTREQATQLAEWEALRAQERLEQARVEDELAQQAVRDAEQIVAEKIKAKIRDVIQVDDDDDLIGANWTQLEVATLDTPAQEGPRAAAASSSAADTTVPAMDGDRDKDDASRERARRTFNAATSSIARGIQQGQRSGQWARLSEVMQRDAERMEQEAQRVEQERQREEQAEMESIASTTVTEQQARERRRAQDRQDTQRLQLSRAREQHERDMRGHGELTVENYAEHSRAGRIHLFPAGDRLRVEYELQMMKERAQREGGAAGASSAAAAAASFHHHERSSAAMSSAHLSHTSTAAARHTAGAAAVGEDMKGSDAGGLRADSDNMDDVELSQRTSVDPIQSPADSTRTRASAQRSAADMQDAHDLSIAGRSPPERIRLGRLLAQDSALVQRGLTPWQDQFAAATAERTGSGNYRAAFDLNIDYGYARATVYITNARLATGLDPELFLDGRDAIIERDPSARTATHAQLLRARAELDDIEKEIRAEIRAEVNAPRGDAATDATRDRSSARSSDGSSAGQQGAARQQQRQEPLTAAQMQQLQQRKLDRLQQEQQNNATRRTTTGFGSGSLTAPLGTFTGHGATGVASLASTLPRNFQAAAAAAASAGAAAVSATRANADFIPMGPNAVQLRQTQDATMSAQARRTLQEHEVWQRDALVSRAACFVRRLSSGQGAPELETGLAVDPTRGTLAWVEAQVAERARCDNLPVVGHGDKKFGLQSRARPQQHRCTDFAQKEQESTRRPRVATRTTGMCRRLHCSCCAPTAGSAHCGCAATADGLCRRCWDEHYLPRPANPDVRYRGEKWLDHAMDWRVDLGPSQ